jgi:hypothetical protein
MFCFVSFYYDYCFFFFLRYDNGSAPAANDPVDYLFRKQAEVGTNEGATSQFNPPSRPFSEVIRDLPPIGNSFRDRRPSAGDSRSVRFLLSCEICLQGKTGKLIAASAF